MSSRPHINIPPGARPPVNPSPSSRVNTSEFPRSNIDQPLYNPWDAWDVDPPPISPGTAHPRHWEEPSRPRSRTSSVHNPPSFPIAFPEPQMYRSASASASQVTQPAGLHPNAALKHNTLKHHHSRSDVQSSALHLRREPSNISLRSTASSYMADDTDSYNKPEHDEFTTELSNLLLMSEEGLRRFQSGELPANDQEWYKLVPPEAREALGKDETQRQSVIFEVFKGEQEYVADLQAVKDVFIQGLRNAKPSIIPTAKVEGFIGEVFFNLDEILTNHRRMLEALYVRQRDQHPLIHSVADIILDITLQSSFRTSYETYIKHYPIAESRHRTELNRNPAYATFVASVSSDPRIRKRDLITFLSRPVTRLPRFNLVLEQILKLTKKIEGANPGGSTHEDIDSLPLILGILTDCIKSTQPGIEAAQKKVDFWKICESLVYQPGEIMDMDLYDDSRTLVHEGSLARRTNQSEWSPTWVDLNVVLLDNFLLFTKQETRPSGVKRHLTSRPIPLWYLRLGGFDSPVETRKEKADDGRLLESFRTQSIPVWPFTVYHAASKSTRRYTLYAASEAQRERWHTVLKNAIFLNKVSGEANMWFNSNVLSDKYFRVVQQSGQPYMGRITSLAPFSGGGRKLLAVGCATGIYVGFRGESKFLKVLNFANPTNIAAVETFDSKVFNKFIVHFEGTLLSYSLDQLGRVAHGQAAPKTLLQSLEKISANEGTVLFFKPTLVGARMLLIYGSKRTLQSGLSIHALEVLDTNTLSAQSSRGKAGPRAFRPFGEPGYVPKDAFDVAPLVKSVGICTSDGIVILDPTNLATSATTRVPDLREAASHPPMTTLKEKLVGIKPLGLVRCEGSPDFLVIYETLGCYVTKHGQPSRSCGYIKWESPVTSFCNRGVHVLLFSSRFIEIRDITTGRLVQVIEGEDIRLLYAPRAGGDNVPLVAMRAPTDGNRSAPLLDQIVELVETFEIVASAASTPTANVWEEWDLS